MRPITAFISGCTIGLSFGSLLLGGKLRSLHDEILRRGHAEKVHVGYGFHEIRWLDKPKDSLPADH